MNRTICLPRTWSCIISMSLLLMGWAASSSAAEAGKEPQPDGKAKTETVQTSASEILVPLDIKIPRFAGQGHTYPKNSLLDQNEKRPSFMVPKNVKLLSLKKPVTANDNEPIIGETDMITDGDREESGGSFVEYGAGVKWVQIDLKASHEIYSVVIWHNFLQCPVYKDVIALCSDDPTFKKGVKTLFNNDWDNSVGLGVGKDLEYVEWNQGKLIDGKDKDGKPAKARYLRFYSNGSNFSEVNRYTEIDIYGRP